MFEGPADVAGGHGAQLALLKFQPLPPAAQLSEFGSSRRDSLTCAAALGSEVEEPVQREPEELQLVLGGADDCVTGPLNCR